MSNLSTIMSVVSQIRREADTKIGEALIDRAGIINSLFDDAYGSCLGGHYASGMECLAVGLKNLEELIEYAHSIAETANGAQWEYVRDALGSVELEKAPMDEAIRKDLNRKISWLVSPGFGDMPRCVACVYDHGKKTADTTFYNFRKLIDEGRLESATMYWNGAAFDYENGRWIFDCQINPSSRPDLAEYC